MDEDERRMENLHLVLQYIDRVTWDKEMARLGRDMYQFNCNMFDPSYIPPKKYRRLIQYFMIGMQDVIPYHIYAVHYLRSLTPHIKTVSDLDNWMNMVNQFPPGTPLRSRPYGTYETFMGVCFYTNPLPPSIPLPMSQIN